MELVHIVHEAKNQMRSRRGALSAPYGWQATYRRGSAPMGLSVNCVLLAQHQMSSEHFVRSAKKTTRPTKAMVSSAKRVALARNLTQIIPLACSALRTTSRSLAPARSVSSVATQPALAVWPAMNVSSGALGQQLVQAASSAMRATTH